MWGVTAVWHSRAMTDRTLRLTIGVLGTVFAVVGEAIELAAGTPPSAALLNFAIGLTYLYGGLAIWTHEPPNNTGRLMTAVGVTFFIGGPAWKMEGAPLAIGLVYIVLWTLDGRPR